MGYPSNGIEPHNPSSTGLRRIGNIGCIMEPHLQGLHSYACGQYCLVYLKMKARGGSLQDFLALFSEHDYVKNDQKVGDMLEYAACRPGQQSCQMREKVIKSVGWYSSLSH